MTALLFFVGGVAWIIRTAVRESRRRAPPRQHRPVFTEDEWRAWVEQHPRIPKS